MDAVELLQPDGRVARVPYAVILDAWLAWLAQGWRLDPQVAAALAASLPEPNQGEIITGLRAECRRRLGLAGGTERE